MLGGAGLVLALVCVLLAMSFLRHRSHRPSPALWLVGGGIVFPMTVLGVLLVAGLILGERSIPGLDPDAPEMTAESSQYRWRFAYPGTAMPDSEGTLHIPAGRPVVIAISSTDVIHSFWVPQLAGKMDAIPGHVNRLRLEASQAGTYQGVCAEYCGIGHARHGFQVMAHDPDDWAALVQGGQP